MSLRVSQFAPPGRAAKALTGGVVGFLVVMELGSGMLQGWYPVLFAAIAEEFHASAAQLNWISAMYLLVSVVLVPVIGKLGDRYGHKCMLIISASAVALGSAVVALAPDFGWLLAGRALQAPLAAFLPLEFAIVRDRDEINAGRSIGKLVGALTLGAAIGALGAGLLYNVLGQLRPVLWVPAIFLMLCVPVVVFLVPESTTRAAGRVDWLGAALLGIGLLVVLGGISNAATWGWANVLTWTVLAGGLIVLAAWVAVEKRIAHPLVDLHRLTRGGIGLPIVLAFLFGAQLFGSQTASTLYMLTDPHTAGFGAGLTAGTVGVVSVVAALAAFVAAILGDRTANRIGNRVTLFTGGLIIVSSYLVWILGPATLPGVVVAMVLGGLGNGLIISVLPTIVVRRAPADSVGIASALYNTSRTAGGAVAGAVFALAMASLQVVVASGSGQTAVTSRPGYIAVWAICAAISLVVAALSLRLGRHEPSTGSPTPAATAGSTTTHELVPAQRATITAPLNGDPA
jgi:MFS family permease